jgi:hypothetical protein
MGGLYRSQRQQLSSCALEGMAHLHRLCGIRVQSLFHVHREPEDDGICQARLCGLDEAHNLIRRELLRGAASRDGEQMLHRAALLLERRNARARAAVALRS